MEIEDQTMMTQFYFEFHLNYNIVINFSKWTFTHLLRPWKCHQKMPFEASWDIFWSLTVRGVEESKLKPKMLFVSQALCYLLLLKQTIVNK